MRLIATLLLAALAPPGEPLESAVFRQVNQWRTGHSLPALRWNEHAAEQARQHSKAIAAGRRRIGHDGFAERLAKLRAIAPIAAAAENIAVSSGVRDAAGSAVSGWAASPGHRKNMADNFTETGVGVAVARNGTVYVTQIYLTPVRLDSSPSTGR